MPATWVDPPRDFVAGELITATIANQEWRDRMMYLKAAPAFTGNVTIAGTLGVTGAITGNLTGNVTGNVSGTAPAGTLTGATLAANVLSSSLTSVGTITTGAWNAGALTSSGLLTVNSFGSHTFTGASTGNQEIVITNTSNVSPASAGVSIVNDAGFSSSMRIYNSAMTPSGPVNPDGAIWAANGAGGVSISASHSTGGNTRFYNNGTERLRLLVGGDLAVTAAKKLYLDGVAGTGDTYITESSANVLALVSGGITSVLTSGVLTVGGFGTHKLTASGTGANSLWVENPTAGTGNLAFLGVLRDATIGLNFSAYSSTYTTAGMAVQGGATIDSNGVGGLSIAASSASGPLRLFAGGTTERVNISTAGVVKFNAYTAATFVAGDKYLVVDAAGIIHVSALGPAS